MPVAKGPFHLGRHGVIQPGDEVPTSYVDDTGNDQPTDFARLEELDLVEKPKPKPPQRQRRSHDKKDD